MGRQEIEDRKLLQTLGDDNFKNRDDADDHEGAAAAFFDTSEASRNICPWSCPWMQHAEYVSHLLNHQQPKQESLKSGELRSFECGVGVFFKSNFIFKIVSWICISVMSLQGVLGKRSGQGESS